MDIRTVKSPDQKVSLSLYLNEEGGIDYMVSRGGTECVSGHAGLVSDIGDFTEKLEFTGIGDLKEINERYSIPAGKKAVYVNHCVEQDLNFVSAVNACPFILRVRVYDDGAAFRYLIPASGDRIRIMRENTTFTFPEEFSRAWLQELVASYEAPYLKTSWGPERDSVHYGMPSLIGNRDNSRWVMINEANVLNTEGNYCISHLMGTKSSTLNLVFAPEEHGRPIVSKLPFVSPWRYVLAADDLDQVVNSTLNYNLNPPSMIDDTSWIHPARALWSWWASDLGAQDFTEVRAYVDFAAAMGFEAVLADAGWEQSWVREFCDYAHSKGVQAWIWSDRQRVQTEETAEHYLPLWKSWGVDGVKIDFFEDDSASVAGLYDMLSHISAREHLMVNYHGSTKPMGEGRTWPHFMTAEGIMGMEYYKWADKWWDMPDAVHNCTVPFIRNAVGPMDYTPVGFNNSNQNTSMAHQMALALVFQSGVMHYASSIYMLEPWAGTDFLRRLKPSYDGVRILAGYPGEYVSMLRWSEKTEEYYVGVICDRHRQLKIDLSFLPEGQFTAEVYKDSRMGDEIVKETIPVSREDSLEITLTEHGGAGIYIARNVVPLVNTASDGYMCSNYIALRAAEAGTFAGSIHKQHSDYNDTQVVSLTGGCTVAAKEELPAGPVTMRIFYYSAASSKLRIKDGYSEIVFELPSSGNGNNFTTYNVLFTLNGGPANFVVERISGDVPEIAEIRLIFNHPAKPVDIPVESGVVSGRGYLQYADDQYRLTGIEKGSEIVFQDVMVNEPGRYILRISYISGISGKISVILNQNEPREVSLSGGISVWSWVQPGDLLAREIILNVDSKINTLRICAESGIPDIVGISLTTDNQ